MIKSIFSPIKARPHALHDLDVTVQFNAILHDMLLIGLGISSFVMIIGIILQVLSGDPIPTVTIPLNQIIPNVLAFAPIAYLTLGLLLLIATPILCIVFSIFFYAYHHDRTFVIVTIATLVIVAISLFLSM